VFIFENLQHVWGGIAAGFFTAAILSALLFSDPPDYPGAIAGVFLGLAALTAAAIALTLAFRNTSKIVRKEIAIQPFLNPENGQLCFAVFRFEYHRPRTRNDNRTPGEQQPDDFDTRLHAVLTEKFLLQLSNSTELPNAYSIKQIADAVATEIVKEAKIPDSDFHIYLNAIERPNRRMREGGITIGT